MAAKYEIEIPSLYRVMNINVRSIFQLTMLATPELIKTSGNIVNVSSVNGIRSVSFMAFFV